MTTNRLLPIVNLVGCLLITGIIFAQWLKERGLDTRIGELNKQLTATRDQYETEKTRAAALENDVAQLKESLTATVQARKDADDAMAKLIAERDAQTAELNAQTAGLATAQQEQVKVWEKAIAERDAKIRELNTGLTAARERLNEAIAKLKEAGAR